MTEPSSNRAAPPGFSRYRQGRTAKLKAMSEYEARQRALELVQRNAVPHGAERVIELLAQVGVMTEADLMEVAGVSDDSLLRYRTREHYRFLDLAPVPQRIAALRPHLSQRSYVPIYTLGPVGEVLAERGQRRIAKGYLLDATTDHISHDLLCSHIYAQIARAAQRVGYAVGVHGKYAATIHTPEGRTVLEPDLGLEARTAEGPPAMFLLEYHNEDFGSRVATKLRKYEEVSRDLAATWPERWHSPTLPTLLVVWAQEAVGTAYREALRERRERHHNPFPYRVLGKPLGAFLHQQAVLLWDNLTTGQTNDRLFK